MSLLPPKLFLISLIAMIALGSLLPGPALLPDPLPWLGLLPLAVGAWINVATGLRFHRIGTNIKTFDPPTRMVTDGFFRWSRNPMYLGFVLMTIGVAILIGTLTPPLVAAAFAVICDRWYVRFEERAMRTAFGNAYDAYCQSTRRWI